METNELQFSFFSDVPRAARQRSTACVEAMQARALHAEWPAGLLQFMPQVATLVSGALGKND